jgi:hypothetical protein
MDFRHFVELIAAIDWGDLERDNYTVIEDILMRVWREGYDYGKRDYGRKDDNRI